MKKGSIAIMFMLAIFLVTGLACQIISCDVCGTYVNQEDSTEYIELRKSDVFSVREFTWYIHGNQYEGTWAESQSVVILAPSNLGRDVFNIEGDTLIYDDDAHQEIWVKQQ